MATRTANSLFTPRSDLNVIQMTAATSNTSMPITTACAPSMNRIGFTTRNATLPKMATDPSTIWVTIRPVF